MTDIAIDLPRRRPRFARATEAPSFQITGRDVEIIRHVAEHRFLRSTHISRLLDAPNKKILERLTLLFHAGYLDRPRAQLEYHVQGGGSEPMVYALSMEGARLLAERNGIDPTDSDWTRKNRETGREFILHALAVADIAVALTAACRAHHGIKIHQPAQLIATLPEHTRQEQRPWGLRVRVQNNGATREIGVFPDYAFALHLPDGRRRPFFVECDRGTMPVTRANLDQTSMLRKFLAYEAVRQQNLHTTRYGWQNFRVLITTTSEDRIDTMRAAIKSMSVLKSSPLFLFACHCSLIDADILVHPWTAANGEARALT
jgi:Replication-relaxation